MAQNSFDLMTLPWVRRLSLGKSGRAQEDAQVSEAQARAELQQEAVRAAQQKNDMQKAYMDFVNSKPANERPKYLNAEAFESFSRADENNARAVQLSEATRQDKRLFRTKKDQAEAGVGLTKSQTGVFDANARNINEDSDRKFAETNFLTATGRGPTPATAADKLGQGELASSDASRKAADKRQGEANKLAALNYRTEFNQMQPSPVQADEYDALLGGVSDDFKQWLVGPANQRAAAKVEKTRQQHRVMLQGLSDPVKRAAYIKQHPDAAEFDTQGTTTGTGKRAPLTDEQLIRGGLPPEAVALIKKYGVSEGQSPSGAVRDVQDKITKQQQTGRQLVSRSGARAGKTPGSFTVAPTELSYPSGGGQYSGTPQPYQRAKDVRERNSQSEGVLKFQAQAPELSQDLNLVQLIQAAMAGDETALRKLSELNSQQSK